MAALVQVILLIANVCSSFLTVLLLARFFMQACRAPFSNQVGSFVVSLTNWLVLPLRRVIPPIHGFDSASLVAAYLLQVLFLGLAVSLGAGYDLSSTDALLRIASGGLFALIRMGIYLLIVLLIAQAVLSWVNPHAPINWLLARLTEPVLRPLRRVIPPISNIDLTPLVAIVLAQIVLIFV